MDNLIFKGKTKEELRKNSLKGLEILVKHSLYINESKCYWEVEEASAGSYCWQRASLNGSHKSENYFGMGNTKKLEGCPEVQWILQLLLLICTMIFKSCSTHHMFNG